MFQRVKLKAAMWVLSGSMALAAVVPSISVEAGKKVDVYVVTEEKVVESGNGSSFTSTYKYKYNKNGELTSKKGDAYYYDETYTYNKKGQMTEINASNYTFRNTYDKKGRLTVTRVFERVYSSNSSGMNTYAAAKPYETISYQYNKKDQITGRIVKDANGQMYQGDYFTRNQKGQVTKLYCNSKDDPNKELVLKYQYDKRGNETKYESYTKDEIYYTKNTYSASGLLTKKTTTSNYNDSTVTTYKYKKMSIDKALQGTVNAQQRTLINDEVNGSIPNYYLSIDNF